METSGTERMRRTRERRRNGAVCVEAFEVDSDEIDSLVAAGLLPENARTDREAVTAAVIRVLDVGLAALASRCTEEQSFAEAASEEAKTKAPALAKYRALLNGGELPADLVDEARTADFEGAWQSITDFLARAPTDGREGKIFAAWQRDWSEPQKLVELTGSATLRWWIAQRKAGEEKARRLPREVAVTLLSPSAPTRPSAEAVEAEQGRKEAALKAYRALLSGGVLPADLVAEATGTDIEEAMRDILQFLDAHDPAKAPNDWAAMNRTNTLATWRSGSPEARAEEYGIPFLRSAIERREHDEAEAARQTLRFEIRLELPYAGAAQLARCKDPEEIPEALAKAVAKTFDQWIYPPPEPPKPRRPSHEELLVAAADADSPGAQFRRTVTEAHARLPQAPARDPFPGAGMVR
jgi:hypothetical protein